MKTKVKICGMTRPEDAYIAAGLGAVMVGVIFHPGSPRCVSIEQAAEVVSALPPDVTPVGVFVNKPLHVIAEIAAETGIRMIQLHGGEDPPAAGTLDLPTIKAFGVDADFDFDRILRYQSDYVLLDTKVGGRTGGTGVRFDWSLIPDTLDRLCLILAGGLNPLNVAKAIRAVQPAYVDASSGVESAPGIKSAELMKEFFNAVKRANNEIQS